MQRPTDRETGQCARQHSRQRMCAGGGAAHHIIAAQTCEREELRVDEDRAAIDRGRRGGFETPATVGRRRGTPLLQSTARLSKVMGCERAGAARRRPARSTATGAAELRAGRIQKRRAAWHGWSSCCAALPPDIQVLGAPGWTSPAATPPNLRKWARAQREDTKRVGPAKPHLLPCSPWAGSEAGTAPRAISRVLNRTPASSLGAAQVAFRHGCQRQFCCPGNEYFLA